MQGYKATFEDIVSVFLVHVHVLLRLLIILSFDSPVMRLNEFMMLYVLLVLGCDLFAIG